MKSNYQPHDGDRVRLHRFDGPLGTVVWCKQSYFMVRPDEGGHWWRIERLVAHSKGIHQRTCSDCEIPFLADDFYAPLCPNCENRQEARDSRRSASTDAQRVGDLRRRVNYSKDFQEK